MEKGVLHIYTGNGKGKTSAAMGMVLRSLGYGKRVCVGQFMKGAWTSGEKQFMMEHPQITYVHGKTGFSWIDTDREEQREDVLTVLDNLHAAVAAQPDTHLIVLDEVNVVLSLGYITVEEVESVLAYRDAGHHVIFTGRDVPQELHDRADLITEMREIKHPFTTGIPAQQGVDY